MKNILVLIPMDELHKKKFEKSVDNCVFTYSNSKGAKKEDLEKAEVIIGNPEIHDLKHCKNLKWLHLNTAGANEFVKEGVLPKEVILTNSTGAYGLAISEHMVGMLLEIIKKLHIYRDNQREHLWKDQGGVTSVAGSTILIVGLGDIGTSFAKIVKAMGAHVIGVRRTNQPKEQFIDELYLSDELDKVLPRADVVALSLPSTKDTYKLFSKERLMKMKKGSILINVGRGTSVDTEDLSFVLENNHLLGAALDVTDPEPLPKDHKLWDMKNVVITPHISGWYHLPQTYENIVNIATENLKRFMNNEELLNIVNFSTGY